MKETKQRRLEAAGWAIGSADQFLELSPVEALLVDLRLALGQALKKRRARLHISQTTLAGLIKSSPSRVAKMESSGSRGLLRAASPRAVRNRRYSSRCGGCARPAESKQDSATA